MNLIFNRFDAAKGEDAEESYFSELKEDMDKQADRNKTEFEKEDEFFRTQFEGFRIGTYVRIELSNVPCEFVKYVDFTRPIIVGGLLPGEDNLGFVQVSIF